MEDNKNTGWECPRCGSVNAPQKDKCQCPPKTTTESTEKDNKELLLE